MIFLVTPALIGMSISMMMGSHPKGALGILLGALIFSSVTFVAMVAGVASVGPSGKISENQWNMLVGLRDQLPENCLLCPVSHELIPDDFHLLPIELVQCTYGAEAYGILKLLVAVPLSTG